MRRLSVLSAAMLLAVAGCSQPRPTGAPGSAAVSSSVSPPAGGYAAQIELPFGKVINHLAGVAVDTMGDVYVLDSYYGQVWKLAPGGNRPVTLAFGDIGRVFSVAVDVKGALYVIDDLGRRGATVIARLD